MNYLTEEERVGLRALAQELEDGKNTHGTVSRAFARVAAKNSPQSDLGSRLVTILDPELTPATGQLGPWDASIVFPDGIAVGGFANLTLYQNGAWNFAGHAHVSGGISYDFSFAWAVRDSNNPAGLYLFAHQGRLHATFEAGSRDTDWQKSEINPALAAGWSALERAWSWHWDARVNADFTPFLDDVIKIVAAGTAIGNVVKIFV
jgi:hypothetical protein